MHKNTDSSDSNDRFSFKACILQQKLSGFTLVELIVVITILIILGTIGFVSIGGYSSNARDSTRSSDLANIAKSLDVSLIKTGYYPDPDSVFSIAYSGGTLWKQGTVGDAVLMTLNAGGGIRLSKKPTDPLVSTREYPYSKTAYGNAYQLKGDWEGESIAFSPSYSSLIPEVSASPGNPTLSYIKGNYNGMVAKTETGSMKYLLAIPSLFLSNSASSGSTVSFSLLSSTGFLLNGQSNTNTGYLFPPQLVFSGSSLPTTTDEKILFASGIANAYSGTSLATNSNIRPFIDALKNTNTGALASLGGGVVGSLGGSAGGSSGGSGGEIETPLYTFTTHTFTNCGKTGNIGPAIAMCRSSYSTSWTNTYLNQGPFTGYQRWTVPATAKYRFTAVGAAGSAPVSHSYEGGRPAKLIVEITLTKGQEIDLVIGQHAPRSIGNTYNGGAGGGTYVVKKEFWDKTTNSNRDSTIIVVAGGGANGNYSSTAQTYTDANYNSTSGKASSNGWAGGINGGTSIATSGGSDMGVGGPGAGMYQDSSSSSFILVGGANHSISFLNGAIGGLGYYSGHPSGFGGGGAGGNHGGAGGGGYSGGAGGSTNSFYAGGGGSYWANTTLISSSIDATANTLVGTSGYVTVTKL